MDFKDAIGGVSDTLLLAGILVTAVYSIFKGGRYFQGLITAMNAMSVEVARLKDTLESHIGDEDVRFSSIEKKIEESGNMISMIGGRLNSIARDASNMGS